MQQIILIKKIKLKIKSLNFLNKKDQKKILKYLIKILKIKYFKMINFNMKILTLKKYLIEYNFNIKLFIKIQMKIKI